MKYTRTLPAILAALALMGAMFWAPVPEAPANPRYEGRLAVMLVIDASGSMVWNDPDRARVGAAQKTLGLLKDDDYLALVEFASAPRLIMELRRVGGEAGRREIGEMIAQVGQRGDTDILGGLRTAYDQLTGAPPDTRKFVILLSDGESDVPGVTDNPRGRQRYFAETEELLGLYARAGWPVHCIAFSEEEAGAELANIAGKTGGEYQFIKESAELKNIFASILLAAKYPPGVKPGFTVFPERGEPYLTGDTLAATAYITIGDDRVLPGPYLELTGMHLTVSRPGGDVVTVPFADPEQNGRYRAELTLDVPGEYEAVVAINARYRGQAVSQTVKLGPLSVGEHIQAPLLNIDPGMVDLGLRYLSYAGLGTLYLFGAAFTALLWRARLRERVSGELRVWARAPGTEQRFLKLRLKLRKARKREVKIATGGAGETDFRVEAAGREFAFLIRYVRDPVLATSQTPLQRFLKGPKVLYELTCLPGTVMEIEDRLKTREQLYHGDTLELGGYTFQFQYPYLGSRPSGANVLNAYSPQMGDKKKEQEGKEGTDGKGKAGKVITLRRHSPEDWAQQQKSHP